MSISIAVEIPFDVYERVHSEWAKSDERSRIYGFKRFSFEEWVVERLKDIYNGPQKWGADAILEHSK